MQVKYLALYAKNKEEHYKISDDFVRDCGGHYRQKRNTGYMAYAARVGQEVDANKAEPNQKWHLLESYCARTDQDMEIRENTFKCPELLLWIAEMAGIDETIVAFAAEGAKRIIDSSDDGRSRCKAARFIVKTVEWRNIESAVMNDIS